MLNVAPFTHTMGCAVILFELLLRKTIVFLSKFDEDFYLRTIERYKVCIEISLDKTLFIYERGKIFSK